MAKKKKEIWLCTECGEDSPKWFGKCPHCSAFNTLKIFNEAKIQTSDGKNYQSGVDLKTQEFLSKPTSGQVQRISTSISEVNRVLGGQEDEMGFFTGSVTLFGGHPGIGKSTLALQIFLNLLCDIPSSPLKQEAKKKTEAFYFSGEESFDQVFNRAKRINPKSDRKLLQQNIFSTNSLEDIMATIEKNRPAFVVIDSIQMVGMADTRFGSSVQIRENAEMIIKIAKSLGTTILLIGHVTKNDEIAGPKVLEHLVDTVLYLEGERNSELRLLRAPKNRFGSTLEVGIFEMQSSGLTELKNPVEFFLSERIHNTFGSVITMIRDGIRNFVLELQVLTVKTNFGQPRRTSHGVDLSKFHLLLAVVSKFTPFSCDEFDAYLNVIGGLKLKDPASDLAIVGAILSSRLEKEISADTVILGEVGLSGEIRRVVQVQARILELEKLGFKRVITPPLPAKNRPKTQNIEIIEVKSIGDFVRILFGR